MLRSFRDLDFYCDAYALALEVHRLCGDFPEFERYELCSQMRRASRGIAQNIAEGWGRRVSEKEFRRFLTMALGSCDEMQVLLDFSRDLGYLTSAIQSDLSERYASIARRVQAFSRRWSSIG